jgi:hypothetical protein
MVRVRTVVVSRKFVSPVVVLVRACAVLRRTVARGIGVMHAIVHWFNRFLNLAQLQRFFAQECLDSN